METQNKKLEEEIETKMIQKFGRKLSLISLYETVLQRLIYNTKTDVGKIMKNFTDEIKCKLILYRIIHIWIKACSKSVCYGFL